MIFFNSDEPEPFDDFYCRFQEIYPEKKERNDLCVSVPVINVRFIIGVDRHFFSIHINELEEVSLDVSPCHDDELLEYMALEELLEKLIKEEKIPQNAMFRIY